MDRLERLEHPVEALKVAMEGNQSTIWTTLPGIINSFDATNMTVTVRPAIQAYYTDKVTRESTWINLPLLLDVPIVIQSAVGISLTLPIAIGDECLVSFSSRCIDSWWTLGGIQNQADFRMHDLSDGFAFLGPKSLPHIISNYSTTTAQIRNADKSLLIDLNPTSHAISITASSIVINGALTVNGNIESTGTLKNNSVNVGSTHKHISASPGSLTGVPQ